MNLGDDAYLEALINQPLLVQGAEDPPHTLHKAGVQSLVVIFKVNPSANPLDCLLPFFGISAATDVLRPVKVLLKQLTVSSANQQLNSNFQQNFKCCMLQWATFRKWSCCVRLKMCLQGNYS